MSAQRLMFTVRQLSWKASVGIWRNLAAEASVRKAQRSRCFSGDISCGVMIISHRICGLEHSFPRIQNICICSECRAHHNGSSEVCCKWLCLFNIHSLSPAEHRQDPTAWPTAPNSCFVCKCCKALPFQLWNMVMDSHKSDDGCLGLPHTMFGSEDSFGMHRLLGFIRGLVEWGCSEAAALFFY